MSELSSDLAELNGRSAVAEVKKLKDHDRPTHAPMLPSYRDLLRQAASAMRHDLRRTLLTMAGMAWGIATVVLLLAYGNGFGQAIQNIFESFGATAVGVFPGRTSLQAGGNKAGVQVRFTNDDIELLRNNVPLCKHVVRMSQKDSTVQNDNRSFTFPVMGLDPSIQSIWNL